MPDPAPHAAPCQDSLGLNQVSLLVDSLIRGWPFGTLLMWKVGQGELQNIPHRQFWRVVERTADGDGSVVSRKDPPAFYHMVLDGQQRVQSLLLALGGDGWGIKLEDRDWAQELQDRGTCQEERDSGLLRIV